MVKKYKSQKALLSKYSDYIDWSVKHNLNLFRSHKNNSDEHELAKYLVYRECIKKDINVMVECHFRLGGRADIFNIDSGIVVEILSTETMEQFQKKKAYYPKDLILFPIVATEIIKGRELF